MVLLHHSNDTIVNPNDILLALNMICIKNSHDARLLVVRMRHKLLVENYKVHLYILIYNLFIHYHIFIQLNKLHMHLLKQYMVLLHHIHDTIMNLHDRLLVLNTVCIQNSHDATLSVVRMFHKLIIRNYKVHLYILLYNLLLHYHIFIQLNKLHTHLLQQYMVLLHHIHDTIVNPNDRLLVLDMVCIKNSHGAILSVVRMCHKLVVGNYKVPLYILLVLVLELVQV